MQQSWERRKPRQILIVTAHSFSVTAVMAEEKAVKLTPTYTHTHTYPRRVKDIHVTAPSFSVIAAVMAEEKAQKFKQEHEPHDAVVYAANYNAHRQGITPVESTQVYDQWITYDQVTTAVGIFVVVPETA